MIFMALDHANHFIAQKHSSGEYWGGPFPEYDNTISFLTRLVTHLSAPGFFFLMGMGMWLFANSRREKGWSTWQILGHFVLRGSILIALQFILVNPAWELSPSGWVLETYVGVLFALGGSMILLSFPPLLNARTLLPLTILLLFLNGIIPPDPSAWSESFSTAERLLTTPGGDLALWVNYPILSWLSLVTFGMLFGYWLKVDKEKAYQRSLWIGIFSLLTFLVTRTSGNFWNIRPSAGDSWIDFLNVVKYPPSLTFIMLTMGINLILLWAFSKPKEKYVSALKFLITFGRVPLFFYITHLYLYAALAISLTPKGTSIPLMYIYWILGLLILYPLSSWYKKVKAHPKLRSILQFL